MTVFSQRLKELRLEKGLSLRALAKRLDIPYSTYTHYERGEREPPLDVLVLICDLFNVSADYLLGRVDGY